MDDGKPVAVGDRLNVPGPGRGKVVQLYKTRRGTRVLVLFDNGKQLNYTPAHALKHRVRDDQGRPHGDMGEAARSVRAGRQVGQHRAADSARTVDRR